jgi:hypothetical protein
MAKKNGKIRVGGKATRSGNLLEALRFGQLHEVKRMQRLLQSQNTPVDVFMRAMNRKYGN